MYFPYIVGQMEFIILSDKWIFGLMECRASEMSNYSAMHPNKKEFQVNRFGETETNLKKC